jgi:pimeloyl-ACP methyl ester carboxylesterase
LILFHGPAYDGAMNILLLRGLSREQRHWGRLPELLQQRYPELRVHCLDLPGAGTEYARPSPTTLKQIAEDVRGRWLELRKGTTGPWAIFGMSLGGMVTMQWSGDHPTDFARVILANTSAANLSAPWRRLDWRVLPSIVRALLEKDPVARERIVLSVVTKVHTEHDVTAREWASYQADRPMERKNVIRQLFAASRFRAPEKIAAPVLVLAGGKDPLTDPSCPKLLAQRFGAELRAHPEAGHELALDVPDWLVEQLGGWLAPAAKVAASA